jgi:hypothetical protein
MRSRARAFLHLLESSVSLEVSLEISPRTAARAGTAFPAARALVCLGALARHARLRLCCASAHQLLLYPGALARHAGAGKSRGR